MDISNIKTITRYEMKLLSRTARFWILCGIGFVAACMMTAFAVLYNIFGSGSMSLGGMMEPGNTGYYSMLYFNIVINTAMIFFVLNFSSKDYSSKVKDVLLSKSLTSFEIIGGKYLGIVIPIIIINLITIIISLLASLIFLDVPIRFGNYLSYFLIVNLPSILYISAFNFFIVQLVKNRFAGILLSLAYVGVVWFYLSKYFYHLFDFGFYAMGAFSSDLIGFVNITDIIIQRFLYIILGIVFLCFTILLYPRLRQDKRKYSILKISIILLILVSSAIVIYFPYKEHKRAEYRKAALEVEKRYSGYKSPLLKHYSMKVNLLNKSVDLEISADMKIINDTGEKLENLIFSLNPGLEIDGCFIQEDGNKIPVNFKREYSIIEIDISESEILAGDSTNIVIEYKGSLDEKALFLEFDESKNRNNEDVILQEITGAIYYWRGKDYSFLLPETGWYPTVGADCGYEYPEKKRVCFSTSDISITVPKGYTALTQGELVSSETDKDESIYKWVSDKPVPKFSINSGKYKIASISKDNINYSLYYSPRHNQNISFFSDVSDSLTALIHKRLAEFTDRTGIDYPYKSVSLIEVPVQTAEFSKSLFQSGVKNQPGISMMKEGGLLTANFKRSFKRDLERLKRNQGDTARVKVKLDILNRYIRNMGIFGTRIDHNLIPNYWGFRFEPKGILYPLLTFGMNDFVTEWITGAPPTTPRKIKPGRFGINMNQGGGEVNVNISGIVNSSISSDSLYKLLEEKSLSEFLPEEDTDLFKAVIKVKGEAMFKALRGMMGEEDFGELLKTFVTKYSYSNPTIDDFKKEAEKIYEKDLNDFFSNWLYSTRIPGFQLKNAEAFEIESEIPSYQVVIRLKNGEDAEGYVNLLIRTEKDRVTKFLAFSSYEEKEIKIIVPDKPNEIEVQPFFSLNRVSFSESINIAEHKKLKKGEEYVKTISKETKELPDEIIVDNLDENFYVEDLTEKSFFRPGSDKSKKEELETIGRFRRPGNKWGVRIDKYAYGKYRHTSLEKKKGSGKHIAVWKADILEPGEYFVYYYINYNLINNYLKRRIGKFYKFKIYHDDGEEKQQFDVKNSISGWNELGSFHFSKGEYKVELSDESDGFILADAVKWVRKQGIGKREKAIANRE